MSQHSRFRLVSQLVLCALLLALSAAAPADAQPASNVSTQAGVWQCWNDGSPDPCHNNLYSVDMLSSTDGWAVGAGGIVLHWDGSTWRKVTSPTTNWLYSVTTVSATDGWAVGNGGTILNWNGSTWDIVTSTVTDSLSSIVRLFH